MDKEPVFFILRVIVSLFKVRVWEKQRDIITDSGYDAFCSLSGNIVQLTYVIRYNRSIQ